MINPLAALMRQRDTVAAFQRVFSNLNDQDTRLVLAELARFGYYQRSTMMVSPHTGTVDPLAMALAEGRREMLLHVLKMASTPLVAFDRVIQQENEYAAE